MAAFTASGMDLKALAGKRVRVRGWVMWRNGPMIEATHPEQIELLADGSKGDNDTKRPKQESRPAIAL